MVGVETAELAQDYCECVAVAEQLAEEVYTIGDAKQPRSAVEAIFEGARVAMSI